jgi:mRNA-degrading endonuclease RelE of RelBE toxin-antitoxin system
METIVTLSKKANKDLKKIPKHILIQFDLWVEIIETEGLRPCKRSKATGINLL